MIYDFYELETIINGAMAIPEEKRKEMIEDALRFEECDETKEELEAMTDEWLARTYRRINYDYALGQM